MFVAAIGSNVSCLTEIPAAVASYPAIDWMSDAELGIAPWLHYVENVFETVHRNFR